MCALEADTTYNILLTFYRHTCSVVVLSSRVHRLTLIGAAIFKLHVVQVQMSPRHPHLVIGWQLSVQLLPADLRDGAGRGRATKIIHGAGFKL